MLGETRHTGAVSREARVPASGRAQGRELDNLSGRITYEKDGSKQRVIFHHADISDPTYAFRQDDVVSFLISTDQRDKRQTAKQIELVEKKPVNEIFGIISTVKDGFGFIDRADEASEIFFHFSEYARNERPEKGDNVSFELAVRQGKPFAQNVCKLAPGSVTFEEVSSETVTGKIAKPLARSRDRRQTDIPSGRVEYTEPANTAGDDGGDDGSAGAAAGDGESAAKQGKAVKLPFSEKCVAPECTEDPYKLRSGDVVSFSIARDKRNNKSRAVNIILVEKAVVKQEKREGGVINVLKDGYGFILCADRDARLFFHFSELLDRNREIRLSDHVDFAVEETAKKGRQGKTPQDKVHAVRIQVLPPGSIKFDVRSTDRFTGKVTKAPPKRESLYNDRMNDRRFNDDRRNSSPARQQEQAGPPGEVVFTDAAGKEVTATFHTSDVLDIRGALAKEGDTISFNTLVTKRNGATTATAIEVVERAPVRKIITLERHAETTPVRVVKIITLERHAETPGDGPRQRPANTVFGLVSSIKESFGFIEALPKVDREIFFHFSEVAKDQRLRVGEAVSYTVAKRSGKMCAMGVAKVTDPEFNTMQKIDPEKLAGVVVRAVRSGQNKKYGGILRLDDGTQAGASKVEAAPVYLSVPLFCSSMAKRLTQDEIHAKMEAKMSSGATNNQPPQTWGFGISGIKGRNVVLRAGDRVSFCAAEWLGAGAQAGGTCRAVDVVLTAAAERDAGPKKNKRGEGGSVDDKVHTARVETTKGDYGFIAFKAKGSNADSLFFHFDMVLGDIKLDPGDEVEFQIFHAPKTGKYSASNVKLKCRKLDRAPAGPRPAYLSKVRTLAPARTADDGPRFGPIREPLRPADDGSNGFVGGLGRGKLRPTAVPFMPVAIAERPDGDAGPEPAASNNAEPGQFDDPEEKTA